MIQRADNNGDGDVDFVEFCELMCVAFHTAPAPAPALAPWLFHGAVIE